MLKRFQFEGQMDRIEAEVRAGNFNDRRPSDVRADEWWAAMMRSRVIWFIWAMDMALTFP